MSLDIDEPQVLAHYPGDAQPWQHRVLLRRLRDAIWVVVTPDFRVEVADLGQHGLLPWVRGAPVPRHLVGQCQIFGGNIDARLPGFRAQAARLANILGGAPTVAAAGGGPLASWRVADTAAPDFGQEVSDDVVDSPGSGVTRGAVGLARCGEPPRWVAVEHVPLGEVTAWEQDKQSGAGRDRRLGVPRGYLTGTAVLPLNEAASGFRPRDLKLVEDWPHQGPRAVTELVAAIQTLGLNLFTYHEFWVRQSGIHGESAVSWEHKTLLSMLATAICYDRLDATNVAALELAARRVVMIERAVRVNPKAPSFVGLHKMIEHALDEGGGVATREFTAHMASLAEAEARILKQNRLLREESSLKKKEHDPQEGGGGGGRRKKIEGGHQAAKEP